MHNDAKCEVTGDWLIFSNALWFFLWCQRWRETSKMMPASWFQLWKGSSPKTVPNNQSIITGAPAARPHCCKLTTWCWCSIWKTIGLTHSNSMWPANWEWELFLNRDRCIHLPSGNLYWSVMSLRSMLPGALVKIMRPTWFGLTLTVCRVPSLFRV